MQENRHNNMHISHNNTNTNITSMETDFRGEKKAKGSDTNGRVTMMTSQITSCPCISAMIAVKNTP